MPPAPAAHHLLPTAEPGERLALPLVGRGLRRAGLWANRDWVLFLGGQSVSIFGSQFTGLALPLTAVVVLKAGPGQMGILGAAQWLPGLLFGLPVGAWLDRRRRHPVLVFSNLLSMVALATVPAAALLHRLSIEQLYSVAFIAGLSSVFFVVAQNAFLPALAGRKNLVQANSHLQTSRTVAQLAGPGLAGALVQLVTAPVAIAVDAFSFLVAAVTSALISTVEPVLEVRERGSLAQEIRDGVRVLWSHPLLRSILLTITIVNFAGNMSQVVVVLLFVGHLHVTPTQLGLSFAAGSASALLGAQLTRPLAASRGVGPVMVLGAALLLPVGITAGFGAAFAPPPLVFPMLVLGQVIAGFGLMTYNINQQAIRGAIVPNPLLGRATAGFFFLAAVAQLSGSLIGGALGSLVGLYWTYGIAVAINATSILAVLISPLPRLRELPKPTEER